MVGRVAAPATRGLHARDEPVPLRQVVDDTLEIRVLGPIEVAAGGAPIEVSGARRLGVLARLASTRVALTADHLVTDVWPGDPPSSATANVHTYVSQLRQQLGADSIRSTRTGYKLDDDVKVDAARFESEVKAAITSGDSGEQERGLAVALLRWRGDAYQGFEDLHWARGEAARLGALRIDALERRFDAALECGVSVVTDIEAAVRDHPLHERFWAQLMIGLYRADRQADALRAYERIRRILGDELGLAPSPRLTEVEHAILTQDPRLDGSHAAGAPPPMHDRRAFPSLLEERREHVLIGRVDEAGMLSDAWNRASTGAESRPPRIAVVAGEPGVGKTRLVAEVAWHLHAKGAAVGFGRCDELVTTPYRPVVDALQSAGETAVPVAAPGSAWARSSAEVSRWSFFEAVGQSVVELSRLRPLLLVIDDLQWADDATVLLLRHLVTRPAAGEWLVLATCRDTDLEPGSLVTELLADLDIGHREVRLTLPGLSPEDVAKLLASVGTDDAAVARAIAASTAGNPFLALELANELTRATGDTSGVPAAVAALTARRLARLGRDSSRILTTAALFGETFDAAVLAAVDGLGSAGLIATALDAGARARLVLNESPGRYRFAHALLRDAILSNLGSAERAAMHARIAAALETAVSNRVDNLPAIALHWSHAAPLGYGSRAVDAAIAAAGAARSSAAPEEAMKILSRVRTAVRADPTVGSDRLAELCYQLAEAHDDLAQVEASREASWFAAGYARDAGDVKLHARAAACFGRRQQVGQPDARMIPLLEEAIAALRGTDPALEATVAATLAAHWPFVGNPSRGNQLARRALELARTAVASALPGASEALLEALGARLSVHQGLPDWPELREVADELVALTGAGEEAVARGLHLRGQILLASGDRGAFERDVAALDALGRRVTVKEGAAQVAQWRALLALLDGRFAAAGAEADAALALAPETFNIAIAHVGQHQWLRLELGENDSVADRYAELVVAFPTLPVLEACLALSEARAGRPDAAPRVAKVVADGHQSEAAVLWPATLAVLAEAVAIVGDPESAAVLLPEVTPYGGQLFVIGEGICCFGSADRSRAQLLMTLGDLEAADDLFTAATALEKSIEAPPLVARTELWHGRALIDRRDRRRGTSLLRSAESAAARLGMAGIEREARRLIDA